jgi:hypothetical protein
MNTKRPRHKVLTIQVLALDRLTIQVLAMDRLTIQVLALDRHKHVAM